MINNSQNIPSTPVKKTTVESNYLEVTSCSRAILNTVGISNGKLYHTTDTNEFFYDWADRRIQLDLFGTGSVDYLNEYIKKGDNVSSLNNDEGYIDIAVLEKYLKDKGYDIKKVIKDEIKSELTNATDIVKLDERVDAAKIEILHIREELKNFKETTDITLVNINNNIYAIGKDIDGKIDEINRKIDRIKSSLIDKDYVDDGLASVRSDLKTSSDKIEEKIKILKKELEKCNDDRLKGDVVLNTRIEALRDLLYKKIDEDINDRIGDIILTLNNMISELRGTYEWVEDDTEDEKI